MLFTPRVSSMVAISVVWMFILNPQYGLLNSAPVSYTHLPHTRIILTLWHIR